MAGYYDKNKDYSKELQRTDLSSSERERLTQERQNKINDRYGGKEPNMIGSDKTYSQTYGGSSSSSGGSRGGSSRGSYAGVEYDRSDNGGGLYGTPTSDSQQRNYTQGGVTYQVGPDMSRRQDLAGRTLISNGYTVFYDNDGYAYKASKGVTDYTPHQDINAGNGSYDRDGAWTDNEILSALDRAKIAAIRGRLQRGEITGDQANAAANAIRAGYGYTIDKSGYVTDNGALSRVNDRRQQWGLPTDAEGLETQYYRYLMDTDISPEARLAGRVDSIDQFAQNGGTYSGSAGGQQRSYDVGDGSDYLKELYAQRMAAELAALKSAYEKNTATLDASREQIPQTFDIARNSAADQNARSRGAFQEMAVANGLNTGTTGQAALAQDIAYQQALSEIDRQQAQKIADLDLQRNQLDTEYQNAIAEAQASGNAELASALYEEYVRQQNLAASQSTAGTSAAAKPTLSASQVQSALKAGIVTDDVISAFDYYYGQGAYNALYGTGKLTAGTSDTGKKGSYSNGSLTNEQVKQMQTYYGVTADGKWGTNSKKAAGGMTADEAWAAYQGQRGRVATKTNSAGVTATGTDADYATISKNSAAGAYGPRYGVTLGMIQAQFGRGADAATLSDMVSAALERGDINEAGADTILRVLGF